jgi:O-antigen/teichoic acid export membrane protein
LIKGYRNIWRIISESEFTKNLSTQILGTGLAQAIPFLATPALTRLYSQEDFARYTSFFAIATVLAVVTGGRYYLAIVLPREPKDAIRLFGLSNYITVIYAFVLFLIFFFLNKLEVIKSEDLVYFVPMYVLFYGIWISLINLSIREKAFRINAASKIFQSAGYIITAIAFGFFKLTFFGLILGKISGTLGSGVFLLKKLKPDLIRGQWSEFRNVALKYIDYPKFSVAPALLNTLSAQALVLFLTEFYTPEDLGYYGLTFMVMSAPIGLIGTSYRDVFYQKMADLIKGNEYIASMVFFKKSAVFLFIMGSIIALILYFFGADLFGIIFGKDWIRSGEFASILALSFLVKLVASPLSAVFNAANRIRVASIWQITYFITTFLTLFIGCYFLRLEIIPLLYLYLIHEVLLYTVYFVLEYRIIQRLKRSI